MYNLLSRFLKPRWAGIFAVIWYTLLFVLMYALSFQDDPGFLYLNL
ncbi:MAG: hypothetical protein L3J03_06530 [Desulfobacterales bacterium]|nr:hypothetical protein [Desulfobacterales bacterium]